VRALADAAMQTGTDELTRLHGLLLGLAEGAAPRVAQSQGASGQAQAQSAASANPEELAHRFIACARLIDIPARYVAGYRLAEASPAPGRHGWAEAHVPGLGWIGFDPVSCVCPDERYVRVAIGLDAQGAAATRGAHAAGPDLPSEEKVAVAEARGRGA
jgi:transglutaminase-like putative cysteine protease